MPDKKYKNIQSQKWTAFSVGVLIGLAVTFIFLFVFAMVYTMTDIEEYYNAVFATLSLVAGAYFGAMYTVSKIKQKGFLSGMLVGLIMFVLVFIISVFVSKNSFSLTSIFHFICCLLSGGISGIIRVNKEMNKKYLK